MTEEETPKPKLILAHKFIGALLETGIVDNRTRRIVIDAEIGQPVRIYLEKFGDDRLLVVLEGGGIIIAHSNSEAGIVGGDHHDSRSA
jgi:hypothetical protein